MKVSKAIKKRKSVRAFEDREVELELLKEILELASWSPSSTNNQPWEICVVSGDKKKSLDSRILEAFDSGIKGKMDYRYNPDKLKDEYRNRQVELGKALFELLNIKREDKEARLKQWRRNFIAFDAPVSIFFFIDKSLAMSSFIDSGILMQSIALLATEHGLATCMQGSLGEYPDIVRKELHVSDDKILLCGMALGYEDKNAIVNTFQSKREKLEDFAKFYS